MKLAITPFLRSFMTKHRTLIPKTLDLIMQQSMFNPCTHTTCRTFRTQSKTFTITIQKSVHFFFYNIGNFTDRAHKKFRRFHYRRTNFLITVIQQHFAQDIFHVLPNRYFIRQNIVHATNRLEVFFHK